MFDSHVRWYLSASCILLMLLTLGTNAAFTRNVTLLAAAIVILPVILFALLTLEGGQALRPVPLPLARAHSTARERP